MSETSDELIESVFRQFTLAIGRQNRDSWRSPSSAPPKTFPPQTPPPPRPTSPQPQQTDDELSQDLQRAARKKAAGAKAVSGGDNATFVKTLTTHPLPVTVIGSLIAGGVIFLLGLLITNSQHNQTPPASPTTPVTTTTSVPASPPAPTTRPVVPHT